MQFPIIFHIPYQQLLTISDSHKKFCWWIKLSRHHRTITVIVSEMSKSTQLYLVHIVTSCQHLWCNLAVKNEQNILLKVSAWSYRYHEILLMVTIHTTSLFLYTLKLWMLNAKQASKCCCAGSWTLKNSLHIQQRIQKWPWFNNSWQRNVQTRKPSSCKR